ncbi:TIGR03984 family CRISPR-associated protein [Calothrix sp. FACHB-1219]|uniref:type III-D CRISPR-associated protein Csx19 n=1 Tax=unclassified Calothrix TaxID=2619626 RepID=UPI0016857FC9|nr:MULTISPECIES: CRISPR-associated protein Csx19 [unclassified Calothrix]MBD2206446.1 TIGR03984 family CRISPR-associated protein [Calothrix sp. FACHB-168]MBD2220323.1 TIGR03984 family CRISPR-associated protein [Calothrix sp. FACHB-1219]
MNKPKCEPLDIPANFDIKTWLEAQASQYKLNFLLAHAEDGVIWGKFQDGNLITADIADSVFSQFARLRKLTLQQCRIFGENSEVMLWKTDEGFKARLIQDEENTEFIPENQILWGTQAEKISDGFTLVSDGSQGLCHAVPLVDINFDANQKLYRPLRLCVRHYINDDKETGLARIDLSRLVNLTTEKELANASQTSK